MFLIDKAQNRIKKISEKSFGELGFRERENLQEWLANNPSALGEELLIIQKEFSGFSDTNERLDLLALDKQGNLVIIENKLDDSGRNVTWQTLKYASYCSSLKKSQIVKIYQEYLSKTDPAQSAEEQICEFYDGADVAEIGLNTGQTQRLIMVSGSFRREVTSTVMWLLNYGIRIQCFQATPYQLEEQLFLNVEQIIPMKQAEEYAISMAEKTQEDIASQEEVKHRHVVRRKFWTQVLNAMNMKSNLFQNISPSKAQWIGTGSGLRNVGYNFCATKSYGRAELYIDWGEKEHNEYIFDYLLSRRDKIEAAFGGPLEWQRLETKRACRIKYEDDRMNIFDEDTWAESIPKITDGMVSLEITIQPYIEKLKRKVREKYPQE